MNFLKNFFSKVLNFFTGGKAEKTFNAIADLVPQALPIVQAIAAITPTRADDEILAAFSKYGIEASVTQVRATPASDRGYLLLKLASAVMAQRYPGTATNIINSAVQIAVSGAKSV